MKSIRMKDFFRAIDELQDQEGTSKEFILDALKLSLEAAYKENYDTEEEVKVDIKDNGDINVYAIKTVVEVVEDAGKEIRLENAKKIKKSAKIGDYVQQQIIPKDFGRIAVQKGKQIIVQKLREREKEIRFEEFSNKKGEIITGMIQKSDKGPVILDLGKVEGIISVNERIEDEDYSVNKKIRVYVQDVVLREKGDVQVQVSRKTPDFVRRLFEYEIPEIDEGLIEIKSIARDAGKRLKIAVFSKNENIDPVGSCVGQRGVRIQSIIDELNGEKIDVVEYSEDPAKFIQEALMPAEIMAVDINEEQRFAQVIVPDDQLSLAIGKAGQNVRLAVSLTGWKIDIKTVSQFKEMLEEKENQEEVAEESTDIVEEKETEINYMDSETFEVSEEEIVKELEESEKTEETEENETKIEE